MILLKTPRTMEYGLQLQMCKTCFWK